MRLTRLVLHQFRNLQETDLQTDARFVVLHGANAQGKTNALEAVYLISTLKALRSRRRKELIGWEQDTARVGAWVAAGGITRRYRVDLTARQRQIELDGKGVSDLVDWFTGVRCIAFTPQDERIVSAEPSFRRDWLDRAAFTAAPVHLNTVRTYRRILAQKSAVLRQDHPDPVLLDTIDAQLAVAGAELVQRRMDLLDALEPHARALHGSLAGSEGSLGFQVRTQAVGDSRGTRAAALADSLAEARPREVQRRMTLVGPQTDELVLLLDGKRARTYGSRGQVRSIVLALKLAELVVAQQRDELPLFLLDDLSSELDRTRTQHLVGILADLGAQVWVTTTDPDHIEGLPSDETLRVSVDGGRLTPD